MALPFRFAQETDTLLILQFIRELADYEHLLDQVVADEATLRDQLFEKRRAEVLFALEDGAEVGFALFFQNFSTFRRLAASAAERDCGRLVWCRPDWNTPSIGFYKSLGAETMEDWTVYRLTGPALQRLAEPESPVAETDEI